MSHLLYRASTKGDAAAVAARLAAGDDLGYRHKGTGRTALLEAVVQGHLDVVELLAEHGARLDVSCTAVGHSALCWAAEQGDLAVTEALLARGVHPDQLADNSFLDQTPVMLAAQLGHLPVLHRLVDAGADLAAVDGRGRTALALAEEHRQQEAADLLRAAGSAAPVAAPAPVPIPWPDLPWPPDQVTGPPPGADPEQVLLAFLIASNQWEVTAWRHSQADPDYDLAAAIGVATRLRDLHCTTRVRSYCRASVGQPPLLDPSVSLIGVAAPRTDRRELLLRQLGPVTTVYDDYERLFVLVRRHGEWRIDSAKERVLGTTQWSPIIL